MVNSNDLDGPLTRGFQCQRIFEVKYLKTLETKLLTNTNRKQYTIYLMVPLSMTLSDL